MKSYKISFVALAIALAATATSCIDDSSNYGSGDLQVLSVVVPNPDVMPAVNFNYGEECVITPQVKYTGSRQLEYKWSVGTYDNNVRGPLTEVGTEETLTYKFPKGGVYYAHFTVTDGEVGAVQEYEVNINRTFEKGWLIVSNNSAGEGNLSFIKDRTPEEIEAGVAPIIMEHSLERVNDNVGKEKITGAIFIQLSWPVIKKRLLVTTQTKGYFLDPNTFTAISTIDFDKVIPGFKADCLLGAASDPIAADLKNGKYVTMKGNDMFGYAASGLQGRKFDAVFTGSYSSWGNIQYTHSYVSLNPLTFYNNSGYYTYFGLPDWLDSKDMMWNGSPAFANDELVNVFQSEGLPGAWGNEYKMYIMTRNNGKLYTSYIDAFGAMAYGFDLVSKKEIATNANTAIPNTACAVASSDTYHRSYYSSGNNVYVMLLSNDNYTLPEKNQYCLSFGAGEEITYMTVDSDKEELIVATCTTATGRGNIYVYDVANVRTDNPDTAPKAKYMNCADRITSLIYKPRVTT